MSADWPRLPLARVATPIDRTIIVEPGTSYRTIGVKWWGEGAYERETIDGAQTAAKSLRLVRKDDLIINKIWVRHGSTALASKAVDGCAASGEFPTFTLDREQIEPRWIHWLTKTQGFWTQCDQLSQGTSGKNRIKPEKFLTIEIPLPPLAEQRRIVERVEAVAARIADARRLREKVISEQSRFVTSAHCKMAGNRVVPVCDFLELHEVKKAVTPVGLYPQVGVRGFGEGLFSKETISGTDTTYKSFNTLYSGAVVLSQVKGWEGAIAVCPEQLAGWFVSPEYRTFRCRPTESEPNYLAELVKTPWFWERLAEPTRGVGARRERVRPELFLPLRLPMPTIEQQRRAVVIFDKLHSLRALQSETAAELDSLLPSVLNQAFSGEL